LALGLALCARRPILLLDEPGVGLDAAGRRHLIELIRGFAAAGGAVAVASHDPELIALGKRRFVIQAGQAVTERAQEPPASGRAVLTKEG
jgi:ABC-type multidrug transport system ATPase subunit